MSSPAWFRWFKRRGKNSLRNGQRRRPSFRPAFEHLEERAVPTVDPWTVTSTADTGAAGTLRWAINQANADSNPSIINFNIPTSDSGFNIQHNPAGDQWWTITLGSDLPMLTAPDVKVDGLSQNTAQPGYNTNSIGTTSAIEQANLTVGLDGHTLLHPAAPEIAINAGGHNGLIVLPNGTATTGITVDGMAIYDVQNADQGGLLQSYFNLYNGTGAALALGAGTAGKAYNVNNMLIGALPDGTDPGVERNAGFGIEVNGVGAQWTISQNYIGWNGFTGIDGFVPVNGPDNAANYPSLNVQDNEVFNNGWNDLDQDGIDVDCVNSTVVHNLSYGNTNTESVTILSASESANTVTIMTQGQNFIAGQMVTIAGVGTSGYNGTFPVLSATSSSFTYTDSNFANLPTDTNGGTASMSGIPNGTSGAGIEIGSSGTGTTAIITNNVVENNTSINNTSAGVEIRKGSLDNIVQGNILSGNYDGISVRSEGGRNEYGNLLTQNSIYGNTLLGIDLNASPGLIASPNGVAGSTLAMLTGAVVSGSYTVTGLSSTTGLFPGEGVVGADVNSTIASIDSATQITLNDPATGSNVSETLTFFYTDMDQVAPSLAFDGPTPNQLSSVTGTLTSGSNIISGLTSTTGLFAGQTVSGSGIPANTTISSVMGASFIASATESGTTVTITTETPGNFVLGQSITISGVNNPAYNGTFPIASVLNGTTFTYNNTNSVAPDQHPEYEGMTSGSITLSVAGNMVTGSGPETLALTTGAPFSNLLQNHPILGAVTTNQTTATGTLNGTKTVSSISTTGLVAGMLVTGTGILPNTTIASVGANSITLSQAASGSGSQALSFGNITIPGTLPSTPNTSFNIEFYAGSTLDSSGSAEGQNYLGNLWVTTDANGNATFSATLPYTSSYGSYITSTATGPGLDKSTTNGTLTNNSTSVASINTGGLLLGDLVSGTGIPANTIITAITSGPSGSITLSNAATTGGTQSLTFTTRDTSEFSPAVTAPAAACNSNYYPFSSSNQLTNVDFNESEVLRATSTSLSNGTFQLFYNDEHAMALGVSRLTVTDTGSITNGSQTVNITNSFGATPTAGLLVGEFVSGTGIPAGTRITGANSGSITLSIAATSTNSKVTLTFSTTTSRSGTLSNGSMTVNGLTTTADLLVGDYVTGTGIPANTTITGKPSNTSITLSNAATASGNQTLTFSSYNVTPLTANPGSAINPSVGLPYTPPPPSGLSPTTLADQGGTDPSGRPLFPSLYVTDITNMGAAQLASQAGHAGDWQYGGPPVAPNAVFGTWKPFTETIDNTGSSASIDLTGASDPAKNDWNLGTGADPVPPNLTDEGFGAEARWNVSSLGLIPGHTYRFYVIVHDGDQNKTGGDSGQDCVDIFYPGTVQNPSTLSGTVYKDVNNNGQLGGDPGISGVTINLLDANNNLLASTTTAGDGSYSFTNVAPGATYQIVEVQPSAYLDGKDTAGSGTGITNIPASTFNMSGTLTPNSSAATGLSSTASLYVGEAVSGIGIPVNTVIASITNSTSIVLSSATSNTISAGPQTLTFAEGTNDIFTVHINPTGNFSGTGYNFGEVSVAASATSTVSAKFNGTAIATGNTLWLSSVVKMSGLTTTNQGTVTLRLVNSSITIAVSPTVSYTIPVPNALIQFENPPAGSDLNATTSFDAADNTWVTTVGKTTAGNYFLSALPWTVPAGNLANANFSWTGTFLVDTSHVDVSSWNGAAAVYNTTTAPAFPTNFNSIGVKPVDGSTSQYSNTDPAGTPENEKSQLVSTGGALGNNNPPYIGGYTGPGNPTAALVPNIGLPLDPTETFQSTPVIPELAAGSSNLAGTGFGELLGSNDIQKGHIYVAIDLPKAAQASALRAVSSLNTQLHALGVKIVVVSGHVATHAVHIDMASTSVIGGVEQGVLGAYAVGGNITMIGGWNWYYGSNAHKIAANQYDFQTVLTHELGHLLGLGESSDPLSAMGLYLAPGSTQRTLAAADLNAIQSELPDPPAKHVVLKVTKPK